MIQLTCLLKRFQCSKWHSDTICGMCYDIVRCWEICWKKVEAGINACKQWRNGIKLMEKENIRNERGQLTGWGHAVLLRAIAGSVTSGASWKQSDNILWSQKTLNQLVTLMRVACSILSVLSNDTLHRYEMNGWMNEYGAMVGMNLTRENRNYATKPSQCHFV